MTHIIYSQLPLTASFGLPLRMNGMYRTQSDLTCIWTFYLLQFTHTGFVLLSRNTPINVKPVGGGTAWGGGWPWGTSGAFDWFVLLGEGIYESFFARRGYIWPLTLKKETDTDQRFLTSLMRRTVWKSWMSKMRMRASESSVNLTVLSSHFVLFKKFDSKLIFWKMSNSHLLPCLPWPALHW